MKCHNIFSKIQKTLKTEYNPFPLTNYSHIFGGHFWKNWESTQQELWMSMDPIPLLNPSKSKFSLLHSMPSKHSPAPRC